MFLVDRYIANQFLMYMTSEFDRYGKQCTRVVETNRTFLVNRAPLEVLEDSINHIGYDLRGALFSSRKLLGVVPMCPVMINPIHKICLFPSKALRHEQTIWFNPCFIARTCRSGRSTLVFFTNGQVIKVPCSLSSFNTKLQNADQLSKLFTERGQNPA